MVRRHRERGLVTLLFTDIVGSSDIAVQLGDHRWRALQSRHHREVRRQLKRFGGKKSCPHGVPMRGGVAKLRKQGAVMLADLRAKDAAEIVCVYEKDAQFLEFLEGLRLRPSTTVEVLNREYDETMTLRAGGKTLHLGKPATSRIWVRRLNG